MSLGNTCAGCSTHKHADGFVNTNLDILGRGRVYFCAGCVREMAHELGGIDKHQLHALHGQLEELSAAAERLMAEVERERLDKVVPLADVIDFFEEKKKRRPEAQPVKAS